MYLKTIVIGMIFLASFAQAHKLNGVIKFRGAIVQAPCKIEIINEVVSNSCFLGKKRINTNISLRSVRENDMNLSMYTIKYQTVKKSAVLHMNYM